LRKTIPYIVLTLDKRKYVDIPTEIRNRDPKIALVTEQNKKLLCTSLRTRNENEALEYEPEGTRRTVASQHFRYRGRYLPVFCNLARHYPHVLLLLASTPPLALTVSRTLKVSGIAFLAYFPLRNGWLTCTRPIQMICERKHK
jgi:hypothetical protein